MRNLSGWTHRMGLPILTASILLGVVMVVNRERAPAGGAVEKQGRPGQLDRNAEPSSLSDPSSATDPRIGPRAEAGTVSTAKEFVKDFFGEDSGAALAAYEAAGIDLSQRAPLQDWSELEQEFRERAITSKGQREAGEARFLGWPQSIDAEYLKQRFNYTGIVDEMLIAGLERAAADFNVQIKAYSSLYYDLVDERLQALQIEKGYWPRPYHSVLVPDVEREVATGMMVNGGWTVTWALTESDCPEAKEIRDQIQALRHSRESAMRHVLNSGK